MTGHKRSIVLEKTIKREGSLIAPLATTKKAELEKTNGFIHNDFSRVSSHTHNSLCFVCLVYLAYKCFIFFEIT